MHGHKVVEQLEVECPYLCPKRRDTETAPQQFGGAQQQHEEMRGNGDREGEQWQNDERNARLREHGDEIRNRKRLPEQDAALAALPVQPLQTIEQPANKSAPPNQNPPQT